ncbi:MAG: ABC-F family ATP-binding cassette domain-containing protein [Candidatus Cloacimonadaceae bacterium]
MPTDIFISIEEVSKQIAGRVLFEPVSFGIHQNDRIGLVGVNGSGKSTLIKMLFKLEACTTGEITYRNELTVGYLPQIPELNYNLDVLSQVLSEADLSKEDHWEAEHKAKAILSRLKMQEYEKPVALLSGGQKRKVDLARVMLKKPDVLLLDEPTNHLDLDTIEWLQDYLQSYPGAVLLITHDRYFLDAICNRVLEIEQQKIHIYDGGYSDFVEGQIIRQTDASRKEIRRHAQLKKELDWLKRGAKARTSKPKNHVDRVKELLSKSYLISNQELSISFQTRRLGKTILELHNLSKSYNDKQLFNSIDHNFQPKDRIGIIGPNGCGKTTLLRLMTGEEKPDKGSVKSGLHTQFAYYRQDQEDLNANVSVLDYVNQFADVIKTADGTKFSASEMLKRFLFDGKMQQMKVRSLSGGEKKRLHLLVSLMFGSNFLILDEPTNDLDIRTLEILEDYLDAYHGCIVVVSHDRYFLDRVVDHIFIFENGRIRKFAGNYSDYLLVRRFQAEETAEKEAAGSGKKDILRQGRAANALSWKEKQELLALERVIDEGEQETSRLEDKLKNASENLSHTDYKEISDKIESLKEKIAKALERWSELAERDNQS